MAEKFKFQSILETFRKEIKEGFYIPGQLLPTENELSLKYALSRPTISKVYNQLENEGLVRKKAGSGTMVIFKPAQLKETKTIGLLLPGPGESEIFEIITDTILRSSQEKQIKCLTEGSAANDAELRKILLIKVCQSYVEQKVDGVLFSPLERADGKDNINEKVTDMLSKANIPVVLIDRDIYDFPKRSKYPLIGLDNYKAGYELALHLLKAGCEKLFFIYIKNSAASVKYRILGIESALKDQGIDTSTLELYQIGRTENNLPVFDKKMSGKMGIICANDATAAFIMQSLRKQGHKIPEEIKIAGFDDIKYAKHLYVPLTTYRQPCELIAETALEALDSKLIGNPKAPITILLEGKLIERESTK